MGLRGGAALVVVAGACLAVACTESVEDERLGLLVNAFVNEDMELIRSRPGLVASKYWLMASDLYSFFRGEVPLYRRDLQDPSMEVARTSRAVEGLLAPSTGDAHPENFGTLRAADGTFAIEPNDFDSADRYPYFWDLRRLTAGLVLAARLSNEGDEAARATAAAAAGAIARAAALSYAESIVALAEGGPRERLDAGGGNPCLEDLFDRSGRDLDRRAELADLTELDPSGARRLKRGPIDAADPENVYLDLPPFARDALPATLAEYRLSLIDPPDAAFFEVLDAARELGSGVASRPRIRAVVLVRGPSDGADDDVLLEVKELTDSGAEGWLPPGVYADDVGERVLRASRGLWARPDADPFWGAATWVGIPVQVRLETEAEKTYRVHRAEGERGTPEALEGLGRSLGALLARLHASPLDGADGVAAAIAAEVGRDPEAFADEEAALALAYADRVTADWALFQQALDRFGPTLGLAGDPEDPPPADLRALVADPSFATSPSPEGR